FPSRARRPPTSPLFPYTTLFRSGHLAVRRAEQLDPQVLARTQLADVGVGQTADGDNLLAGQAQTVPAVLLELQRDHTHADEVGADRKSTRLNSSHVKISYAVFCL